MNKSLDAHKRQLEELQFAQKIALKEQIEDTKNVTGNVAKLALIGGASAYIGIKVVSFVGRKIFSKKKKNAPQIVYVQAPQTNQGVISPKSFWKGVQASAFAALLPLITNFAKQAGTKAAEKYGVELIEKYKDKLNLDKFFK
jgi:hypothetical protein